MLFKMLNIGIIAITCVLPTCRCEQDYNYDKFRIENYQQYQEINERLWYMMRAYYQDGLVRDEDLKPIRWEYEDTIAYQMGYMIGELLERYKQMIEEVRLAHFNTRYDRPTFQNTPFVLLRKVENLQKLYMEIFHFVRMIIEMPKKFRFAIVRVPFDIKKMAETQDLEEMKKIADELKKKREDRKRQLRKAKHPDYTGTTLAPGQENSKPYNMWWPRDYGWELDAYGW